MAKLPKPVKWLAITIVSVVCLLLCLLAAASLLLTPQRLTSLTMNYGNEAMPGGRLDVKRVELTIWRTFPHTTLEIDSLCITNPRFTDGGDTLLSVASIDGRLNPAALLIGRISISHVDIQSPKATLWVNADSLSNADIFAPSEPKGKDDKPLSLPDIRINRFAIDGDAAVRYVSIPDSTDIRLSLSSASLQGHKRQAPNYRLQFAASANVSPLLPQSIDMGLDGGIGWSPKRPMAISLHDFAINADSLRTLTSLNADFSHGIDISSLHFRLLPTPLQRLASLIPGTMEIKTDAKVEASMQLLKPYTFNPDTLLIPDLKAHLRLTDSELTVPELNLHVSQIGLEATADLNSLGLDRTVITLRRLHADLPGTDLTADGSLTNLATDPTAEGCIKGTVDFSGLDKRVWQMLGLRMRGHLDTDIDFTAPLSALSENGFHKLKLNGYVNLNNIGALLPSDSIALWTDRARLEFGTDRPLGPDKKVIESLLSMSADADSIVLFTPDLQGRLSGLHLGAGVENTATTLDTSTVTPMGGTLQIKRLRLTMADSTQAMVRDLDFATILTRYNNDGRRPLMAMRGTTRRIAWADGTNRASLQGAKINIRATLQPKRTRRKPSTADSLRMKARRDSMLIAQSGTERIDFAVDRSTVRLLKQWDIRGQVSANGARLATPLMPLRMRMTGLDLNFNPDSVMLDRLKLKAGRSDFALSGSITNMQRALGRKRGQPLRASLTLLSDTINVNQLVQAAMQGTAWQQTADTTRTDNINLEAEPDIDESTQSTETRAIVVPMNIDATFSFRAKNIIYSTLLLNDFSGQVIVDNGAAHLSDLHASTAAGSADLNMLYYAPTPDNVDVGLSLELDRFKIGAVDELLPALDTIMPILADLDGVVNLSLGATTRLDTAMNIIFPTAKAMLFIEGDSLKVLDEKTFKTMSKWLLFRDKKKNMIDHMEVEMAVEDNTLQIFPFMFDFDRYRIGVMGHNDLDMNLNYHVSILKSPIPFKFGVNVKGSPGKLKIRPGRARFKENMAGKTVHIADTLRVNLANEIKSALKRGKKAAAVAPMEVVRPQVSDTVDVLTDTISAADSLYFKQNGLEL